MLHGIIVGGGSGVLAGNGRAHAGGRTDACPRGIEIAGDGLNIAEDRSVGSFRRVHGLAAEILRPTYGKVAKLEWERAHQGRAAPGWHRRGHRDTVLFGGAE